MLTVDKLKEILPHGSGIDCDWWFEEKKCGTIHAGNSYHCMDKFGGYVGYIDFTLIIEITLPLEFKLQFNGGNKAQYYSKRFMLREYLEDTIYHALKEGLK